MLPNDKDPDSPKPRRRPRYKGTHPTQFNQRYKELNPEQYPEAQKHVRSRGGTPAGTHVPIMLDEVMATLNPQPGHIVIDGTLGYGGHAEEFLRRIGPTGLFIGLDLDANQLERTRERLTSAVPDANMIVLHSNFAGIDKSLRHVPSQQRADEVGSDIIFVDLGVSSMQIDDPARGFSYKHAGPLDMRMDTRTKRTAADWLAVISKEQLSEILLDFADEPDHERIAARIIQQRKSEPITVTKQLVDLIFRAKGIDQQEWRKQRRRATFSRLSAPEQGSASSAQQSSDFATRLHPAARTFQALRIMVNDELGSLAQLLRIAPYCLRPNGRIGIITFHSGEDRLVKHAFRDNHRAGIYTEIADGPLRATAEERRANPRSAPAKFRWAQKA